MFVFCSWLTGIEHFNDATLGIAIPGSRKPVYRDPARFFNTEIPVLRWPNTGIFGIGVVPKGHIQNFKSVLKKLLNQQSS